MTKRIFATFDGVLSDDRNPNAPTGHPLAPEPPAIDYRARMDPRVRPPRRHSILARDARGRFTERKGHNA